MLIEFKVANFRSIREEQTFSMVASNSDKSLPECLIYRDLPGMSGLKYLKGAAIYGANASGKSNVIMAMRFVQWSIRYSAIYLHPNEPIKTEPFKLDSESGLRPSSFEVTFIADGVRYVFGFSVTQEMVIEEYLVAYPKGVPQRWYHRTYDELSKQYVWAKPSTAFKHDKKLQDRTRNNALFLSVGPQFNHDQLTTVYNWFDRNLRMLTPDRDDSIDSSFAIKYIIRPGYKDRMVNIMRNADVGLADILIRETDYDQDEVSRDNSVHTTSQIENEPLKRMNLEVAFLHQIAGRDPVVLDFHGEESEGTRRLFALLGPWIDILDNGYTVFVDEIETSLHPILIRELLKLLLCEQNNPKGAQVIFTTHTPFLLDSSLLRRDQIWFTEKSPEGATNLYPLTDYQPRKDEALAKGYLAGRYGAIPFIPEGLKL